jgi:nucleoside-diphosphate-sugar epimerase
MNLENKTLLITGIGRFVGLRTAELALARGMKVRGLESSLDKAKKAQELGVEVIVGKLNDKAIAHKACQGVDIVIHTDELNKETGKLSDFQQINVDGTVNIATAAKNAGVRTFVHLSSAMVYGFDYPNQVTETELLKDKNNPYCQTKIEAEKALLELNTSPEFGIIIIRPGDIYGPGSITWVIRPILLMQQKLFAYADDGKGVINHLYIDNLVNAIFLALEKEAHGETFNITDGEQTSWKDYFTKLSTIAGYPPPLSIPKDELKLFIKLRSQGQKLFRKEPDILPEAVDFMTRPYAYSIAKAQNIINYQPEIKLEQGMQHIQEWLKKTDIKKL